VPVAWYAMRQWLGGFIAGQAGGWELVQIGLPQEGVIPVTLRRGRFAGPSRDRSHAVTLPRRR
jgi:nitrogen fixation protein